MVNPLLPLVHRLEKVSPGLAAEVALSWWRNPRRTRALRPTEALVMEDAEVRILPLGRHSIATYRWGSGDNVVLLVHGWEGRAADFVPIVRELRSRDRTIVALDAPGHGRSSGTRTTIPEYGAILAELGQQLGNLDAVVSHSFGTPSVAIATQHGISAARFVSLSGVAQLGGLITTFCGLLGLSDRVATRMRVLAERRMFNGDHTVWDRLSAPESPLPAKSPLLIVHDGEDRLVPFSEADVLMRAHGGNSRMVATQGLGHSRILSDDGVLDAVAEFLSDSASVKDRSSSRV